MKRTPIVRVAVLLASCFLIGICGAVAAPKYTDRENALELAKVLDKSVFRNHLVGSTFIQSAGDDRFFIKVVLDNNVSQNWTIDQIHAWSKSEEILLSGNRVLLFPSRQSARFVVFGKNEFARQALKNTIYAKRYAAGDPLAGRTIHFEVREFNLVELLGVAPPADPQGYRKHFVFDLVNGQREYLSHLDAHDVLMRNGLSDDPGAAGVVMRRAYRLRQIVPHPVQDKNDDGITRFSVEMIFDQPLGLGAEHFPIRMFERTVGRHSEFVLEVVVPNAELGAQLSTIGQLEYLTRIRVVADPQHQKRVLLQARLNPDVLDLPPEIEIDGMSVWINFAKVIDQSVLERRALYDLDLRMRQEQLIGRSLSAEETRKRRTYLLAMDTGLAQWKRARNEPNFEVKKDLMTTALANFKEAALNATTDRELQDAMRERNAAATRIPLFILDYVRSQLESDGERNAPVLMSHLSTAVALTRDPEVISIVREFVRRLGQ